MTPGGAEALAAALKRAVPLVAILVVVGIAAVNTLRQVQGPRYEASARVLITEVDLGAILTGTQPPYVDPERIENQELALATSSELFRLTARANDALGTADELQSAVSVSAENGIFAFVATTDEPRHATAVANAVAAEFIRWRAELSGEKIRDAQRLLRVQIAAASETPELRQQLNQLEVLETLNAGDATLYQRADDAVKTSPAPVRDSLLGGAIGLVVALLTIGTREALNTRVRAEAEVEELLDVPVLATIPSFPRRGRLVLLGRHEQTFGDIYALLAAAVMRGRDKSPGAVVAVTSGVADEGKSLTAANLSIALARRGASVILVDLDTRKPSIAELFGIPSRSPGIVQAISGKNGAERASLWHVALDAGDGVEATPAAPLGVKANSGRNRGIGPRPGTLRVLPAGGISPPGGIAQSRRLKSILENLRGQADVLIVDTPPALQAAEMTELGDNVDAVLLVVRQGRATRRGLRALRRQVDTWSAPPLGAILTDAEATEHAPYYAR